jgi:hypothetical protein
MSRSVGYEVSGVNWERQQSGRGVQSPEFMTRDGAALVHRTH